MEAKTIAFFPEAAYGPALNSVAIAQAARERGHHCVFLTAPDMAGTYVGYGFEEHLVNMAPPMPADEAAVYWQSFVDRHIPNFNKTPYEQLDNYVRECWEAIVETAEWAEKSLPEVLGRVQPDLICVDNVILFPSIKRVGCPWVRIISCSENEIPDPYIPPHLSGCAEQDRACHEAFEAHFREVIAPIHQRYCRFLESCGQPAYPLGQFFEASPSLNLLLYPQAVKFARKYPLDPPRYLYLEGCVRQDAAFEIPAFAQGAEWPLIYVSFGSLGCGDVSTLKRLVEALGQLPVRALVNVGAQLAEYTSVPGNVILDQWFPQPSVIPLVDAVIHHGGNNTFTECLYFAKPALIMPYVWDGHDNATRVFETGHGLKMHRANWSTSELGEALQRLFRDAEMAAKLAATSAAMRTNPGPAAAVLALERLMV